MTSLPKEEVTIKPIASVISNEPAVKQILLETPTPHRQSTLGIVGRFFAKLFGKTAVVEEQSSRTVTAASGRPYPRRDNQGRDSQARRRERQRVGRRTSRGNTTSAKPMRKMASERAIEHPRRHQETVAAHQAPQNNYPEASPESLPNTSSAENEKFTAHYPEVTEENIVEPVQVQENTTTVGTEASEKSGQRLRSGGHFRRGRRNNRRKRHSSQYSQTEKSAGNAVIVNETETHNPIAEPSKQAVPAAVTEAIVKNMDGEERN